MAVSASIWSAMFFAPSRRSVEMSFLRSERVRNSCVIGLLIFAPFNCYGKKQTLRLLYVCIARLFLCLVNFRSKPTLEGRHTFAGFNAEFQFGLPLVAH